MKLRIFGLLVGLIGQFLILALFLWILPVGLFGETSIMWLDFGVVSLVYWLWMLGSTVFSVNAKDESQHVFGALGIAMTGMAVYSVLALGFALICIFILQAGEYPVTFPWQIGIQGGIFFIFLLYVLMAGRAGSQTKKVYYEEKEKKSGKKGVKIAVQDLLFTAEDHYFPPYVVNKIKAINDETRFITPSSDPGARSLDERIAEDCDTVASLAYDFEMNRDRIVDLTNAIDRNVKRRKQY